MAMRLYMACSRWSQRLSWGHVMRPSACESLPFGRHVAGWTARSSGSLLEPRAGGWSSLPCILQAGGSAQGCVGGLGGQSGVCGLCRQLSQWEHGLIRGVRGPKPGDIFGTATTGNWKQPCAVLVPQAAERTRRGFGKVNVACVCGCGTSSSTPPQSLTACDVVQPGEDERGPKVEARRHGKPDGSWQEGAHVAERA
eukprot:250757-Chlamydomonas_euryale.AAC.3